MNKPEIIKPELIIFDWDNTLVESWPKLYSSIAHTMTSLGMKPWSLEEVKSRMHRSSREFFPEVFGDQWEKAKELFYQDYRKNHTAAIIPLARAVDTLKMLKEKNVKLAIISNKTGEYLRKEVEHLGWSEYFDSVLGAYDLDEDKPSPQPVYRTVEQLGLNLGPQNWFVGDTIVDIECAIKSECLPVLFGHQIEGAPHPKDKGFPHTHVLDHGDLMDMVLKAS